MKTIYWLVTAAAVAAAGVTVYTRLSAGDPPLPKVPAVAETPRDVPQLALPPVVLPPDEPVTPVPDTPAAPMPLPGMKPDMPPVAAASGIVPLVPPVPATLPVAPMVSDPPPFEPLVPPTPKPVQPVVPPKPELPLPPSVTPVTPPAKTSSAATVVPPSPPTPLPLPSGPAPVLQPPVPAKPLPLPTPVADGGSREPLAVVGKFIVLKDDKLIEGAVSVNNDTVVVRQGSLDRPFHKSHVQFVAADRDEVYRFMLAKVPATDAAARLKVARWCMFSGLREQALTEAREVQKIQPNNSAAADMVRSLELSLQQFPVEAPAKMTAPAVPTFPAELGPAPARPIPPAAVAEPEPDVTPEAALVFGARVQPFLANQCVECHAKPDFAGKFKLARVTPTDAGPQATRANLRAVAGQIRKDDPGASPLLLKSLSAHGGMKLPAIANRQAVAYQGLEWWVTLAVGTPVAAPVVPAPVPPASPVPPTPPVSPVVPVPIGPVNTDPILPLPNAPAPGVPPLVPIDPAGPLPNPPMKPEWPTPAPVVPLPAPLPLPALPTSPALPPVADPLLPPPLPAVPAPAPLPKPVVPAIPPADNFAPILPPAPPPAPKPVPVAPPVIPPIPPAATAPKPPSPVVPAGTQFGAALPPKPPITGPSGDEFDPAGFNQQPPRK